MTVLTKRKFIIAASTTLAMAGGALAVQSGILERLTGFEELPPTPIFSEDGLAIRGTDPVAIFAKGVR